MTMKEVISSVRLETTVSLGLIFFAMLQFMRVNRGCPALPVKMSNVQYQMSNEGILSTL